MKMRRSARVAIKEGKLKKEAQMEPKTKKKRSNNQTLNIATMDNDTMVEMFSFLNYCQLAENSLVSKRFRNLIKTHRHSLALLYVSYMGIETFPTISDAIKIFDKELVPEAYSQWVIRNNYPKQASLQVESTESTPNSPSGYELSAFAFYKDRERNDRTSVFSARVKFSQDNWPLYQHFVRLATDPFIFIHSMELTPQNDVLNLLAAAINPKHGRLYCKELALILNGNIQRSITWSKNHLRSSKLYIYDKADLNQDEALLDLVVTMAHCTSQINLIFDDISKVMVDFAQKFLDFEKWDEYQCIQFIESCQFVQAQDMQVLKNDYAQFLVSEERYEDDHKTEYHFEFTNSAIGKKLELDTTVYDNYKYNCESDYRDIPFLFEITNL